MALEQTFTIWETKTIIFHELEFTLKSITREVIPADPIDESIPEWKWIFLSLELKLEWKKKSTKFSILSEPYESINQQTWKDYKIQIRKVNEASVKIKIKYEGEYKKSSTI